MFLKITCKIEESFSLKSSFLSFGRYIFVENQGQIKTTRIGLKCSLVFFWLLRMPLSFYRKIVDRIDENKDGYLTTEELKNWIKRVQKRYIYENVAKVWKDYDLNKDNKIAWEEYKQATYGYYLGKITSSDDMLNDDWGYKAWFHAL